MKTATEYDVPENYKSHKTINATCPECGKSNLLRSTDFINGYCICRAFTNPHSFRILRHSEIMKQAKEKREKPFHVVANEILEDEQRIEEEISILRLHAAVDACERVMSAIVTGYSEWMPDHHIDTPDWNEDAHVEITLTVGDCRAIKRVLEANGKLVRFTSAGDELEVEK